MPSLQRTLSGSSLISSSSSKPSLLQRSSSGSSLASGVSKALKVFDRGITGAKHANSDKDVMQEETGRWMYLVIDMGGIRPREDASYSDCTKRRDSARYREGTIVEVDRRRRSGWTQWLGLTSGDGWLFDVSPKDKTVRMVEVDVADGQWQYEPTVERVPVLPLPCVRAAALMTKTSGCRCVTASEVVLVDQRVRPRQMKGSFLRLADGRGWVMDFAGGKQFMRRASEGAEQGDATGASGEASLQVVQPCLSSNSSVAGGGGPGASGPGEHGKWEYAVVDKDGFSLRSGPDCASAKLPQRVEEGEIVTVVERRPCDGTVLLRLDEPQGWAFTVKPGSRARLRLVEVHSERGTWHYVVCADKGAFPRSRCSFSDKCRAAGPGSPKGSFLTVTQRVRIGDSTFLRVEGGWVFDVREGKRVVDGPVASVEPPPSTIMQVEAEQAFTVTQASGSKDFKAPGLRYCRSPCSTDTDDAHAIWGSVVHGTLVADDWLKVGDRYLPVRLNGLTALRNIDQAGVRLSCDPTDAPWASTKLFVLDKAHVQVTLLVQLEGTRWARVASVGGNMEGWVHQCVLVQPRSPSKDPQVQPAGGARPGGPPQDPRFQPAEGACAGPRGLPEDPRFQPAGGAGSRGPFEDSRFQPAGGAGPTRVRVGAATRQQ